MLAGGAEMRVVLQILAMIAAIIVADPERLSKAIRYLKNHLTFVR
jgi:hypothetical protein